jgi:phosphoribosylformylglycinamidine synthase
VPIGATNCLNFGNPERPEIMWQLVEAVEGLADACRALDIPITGGNVSLYNETDGRAIYPTPIIGVVGLIEDASRVLTRAFQGTGDAVIIFGEDRGELGGSEYLKVVHGLVRGDAPVLDLQREAALLKLVTETAATGLLRSAHDCSDGGIAVTLAECCFDTGGIGATVELAASSAPSAPSPNPSIPALFGESASRIVVSVSASNESDVLARAKAAGVPARRIGTTGGSRLAISIAGQKTIDVTVSEAEQIWATALESFFTRTAA